MAKYFSNFTLSKHFFYVSTAFTAEKQVKEVEAQASLLLDRLKPLKMLEENLNRNLSEIKELISQARKQAASVSSIIPDLTEFSLSAGRLFEIRSLKFTFKVFGYCCRVSVKSREH